MFDQEILDGIADLYTTNAAAAPPPPRPGPAMPVSQVDLIGFADPGNDDDALIFAMNDRNEIESLSHTWGAVSYAAADMTYDASHQLTGITYRIKLRPTDPVIIINVGADGQLLPDTVVGEEMSTAVSAYLLATCTTDAIIVSAAAVTVVVSAVVVGEAVATAIGGYRVYRALTAFTAGAARVSRMTEVRTWLPTAINRTTVMAEAAYATAAAEMASRWNGLMNCF